MMINAPSTLLKTLTYIVPPVVGGVLLTQFLNKRKSATKEKEPEKIEIGISRAVTRGIHFSTNDFPLLAEAKYATDSMGDIHLDFGTHVFILPDMFMHYIDDVESIGWSWEPPADFLACLRRGYQSPQNEKEIQARSIGYLTKKTNEKEKIFESASSAGVKDHLVEAKIHQKMTVDTEILNLLRSIDNYVEKNRESLPNPSEASARILFDLKPEELSSPLAKKGCK